MRARVCVFITAKESGKKKKNDQAKKMEQRQEKNRYRLLRNFPRQKFMYLKFRYEVQAPVTTFPLFKAYI